MSDDWMPLLQLPLSREQFDQLPRNAAYRYDYADDLAWLNPRPRYYHAELELTALVLEGAANVPTRPARHTDGEALIELFTLAFARYQPFTGQPEAKRAIAARMALENMREGGDGPVIERASFVAEERGELLGAAFVTLLPLADPEEWDAYHWEVPPPRDCIERREGNPHLTWIFVHPEHAGRGVGMTLLQRIGDELVAMGFSSLLSTFLLGNESSMLWHWRAGFRLLGYPGSRRRHFLGE